MTEEIVKRKPAEKPSALAIMANRMNVEPDKLFATLKATVFKGATNEELLTLVVIANEHDLNPLLKEIHGFPKGRDGGVQPVVGVDGWIKIINRQPKLDGIEFDDIDDEDGNPNQEGLYYLGQGPEKARDCRREIQGMLPADRALENNAASHVAPQSLDAVCPSTLSAYLASKTRMRLAIPAQCDGGRNRSEVRHSEDSRDNAKNPDEASPDLQKKNGHPRKAKDQSRRCGCDCSSTTRKRRSSAGRSTYWATHGRYLSLDELR